MLVLRKKTFDVESASSLLPGEDGAALVRADEIIVAAEAEAAQIREEAKAAYEAEKKRGYDDGIADGKAEILMQKLDLVDESVAYMESIEGKVSDIVLKAIRKCISEMDREELVRQIVRKSLQAVVRTQKELVIKVAPDMVPAVKARTDRIMADFPTVKFIDVKEDSRLTGAACVVETESGIVEASVEGQIDAIERSIRKNFEKQA